MRKILCCLTLLLFLPVAALGKSITLIDDETTARRIRPLLLRQSFRG